MRMEMRRVRMYSKDFFAYTSYMRIFPHEHADVSAHAWPTLVLRDLDEISTISM